MKLLPRVTSRSRRAKRRFRFSDRIPIGRRIVAAFMRFAKTKVDSLAKEASK